MTSERPCSVFWGTVLGSVIASAMFAVEIVTRGAPREGWDWALAVALGIGIGGGIGAATAKVERWALLVAVVLAPPFVLGLPRLRWAVQRAFELFIRSRPLQTFSAINVALLLTVLSGVAATSVVAFPRLPARFGGRLYRALLVATLAVAGFFVGLAFIEAGSLTTAVWVSFTWVAVVGALLAFDRYVNVLSSFGLVFAAAGMVLIPVHYPALAGTFTALTLGLAIMVARYNLHGTLSRQMGRGVTVAAVVVAIGASVAAERIVVYFPTAWRMRAAPGGMTGALYTLRAATDFDGDGSSVAFGVIDCAPFDATRGPHQHETLGNGVDDNCLAGSAEALDPPFIQVADRLAPRPPPKAKGRDVIFYVVDSLRWDDVMELRPEGFAELLDESIVYERAYSTGTFTSQVMMGHLGGRLPSTKEMVWVNVLNAYPSPVPKLLTHYLAERGYDTGLAGGMACDEGTDCSESGYFLGMSYGDGHRVLELAPRESTTDVVLEKARAAWKKLDPNKPRFLWIHDLSVHDAEKLREHYRRRVRASGLTFQKLRREIAPDALWVFTSDHGDEFNEHGGYRHARTLYEEVLRVPLAIHVPGMEPRTIPNVCSTRSIMPTLMALLGLELGSDGPGPYLCLSKEGCTDHPAPAALELQELHLHALVLGQRKIIRDLGQGILFSFDLSRDPKEKNPSYFPPEDLRAALVAWEEQAFGNGADESVWPYRPR